MSSEAFSKLLLNESAYYRIHSIEKIRELYPKMRIDSKVFPPKTKMHCAFKADGKLIAASKSFSSLIQAVKNKNLGLKLRMVH